MAILLVKVERKESLPLNEFFDYNGFCYAISRDRDRQGDSAIKMDDFFEASIKTQELEGITVIFTAEYEGENVIVGWYRSATVFKEVKRPSLFLEGNIVARSSDVVLLPENRRDIKVQWQRKDRNYDIVELEDRRYDDLLRKIAAYGGDNAFLRYPYVEAKMIPSAIKSVEACNEACEYYASNLLNNTCKGIAEIKMLELYGKKLSEMAPKSADGFYYLAMAQCQLGFPKKAIKSIEKAIKLEPDASDLIAQKGLILCSMDYNKPAADSFAQAYELSHDESYLLFQGQAYIRAGEIDLGYECLQNISDSSILENAGIQLKEIDKKWSFSEISKIFKGMR